ncbi:hypothetical protein EHS25_003889 [Saitozyma podzolica]|uniref:Uncharacterized protein n=1 Tax=Saitozyma podzolica TaxID=1890683 RepID=A0A427Y3T7_9TREE|nr:hypothetical protein EHS25_003889 [Saitozyma podzolica]
MSSTTDSVATQLFARDPIPPLEPGKKVYDPKLTKTIASLDEHEYVKAALHLANDDIHNCHEIAQAHEGDTIADILHATLHRREGDYWNSKWWWSRIPAHPTIKSVADSKAFVDACERLNGTGSKEEDQLRERQWDELKGLVEFTRGKYGK